MIDKQEIKNKLSLPAVVEYFTNRTIPKDGKIICPFHEDHNPSCKIYPDHWHCFGCQRHGDVIQWVIESEKTAGNEITFKQALQICDELLTTGR